MKPLQCFGHDTVLSRCCLITWSKKHGVCWTFLGPPRFTCVPQQDGVPGNTVCTLQTQTACGALTRIQMRTWHSDLREGMGSRGSVRVAQRHGGGENEDGDSQQEDGELEGGKEQEGARPESG